MPTLATYRSENGKLHFVVDGGLHFIQGNRAPYFAITADGRDHGSEFGGCCHDLILEHFPQFADLVALHLSDNKGVPMHATANGFYHLGGTHWQTPKYDVAASHFRITEEQARHLTRDLFGESFSEMAGFLSNGEREKAEARLGQWVETQKPRWKAEAEACIAHHSLHGPAGFEEIT